MVFLLRFFPSTQARSKSRTFGEPFSDCKHGNFPYYSPYSQSRHAIFWRLLAWDCIPFRVSFLSLTHSWTYDSIFVFGSFFCSCCLALNIVFFCPTELKTLRELKFDTKNQVAMLLENTAPGVGGWKEVAHRYGMNKDLVKNLETKQDPGTQVMDFLQASKPDLQVYSFCKTLKEKNCFNIVKVLEDELVN